jgi:hypothetical protein
VVRYKAKADRATENEHCITGVFEQLKRENCPGCTTLHLSSALT